MKPIAKAIIDEIVEELYGKPILSNLARPLYVEKLLVRLLGPDWKYVGGDWSGWDLEHKTSRLRLEVKQSAARQSWADGQSGIGKPSKPIFDIRARTGYYVGSKRINSKGRPADLYVFAWHPVFEPAQAVDHTDPEQWEFYLLTERDLPSRKTISLSSLLKLKHVVATSQTLAAEIERLAANLSPLKWSQVPPVDPGDAADL
jgi:hypothetical protein